MLNPYMAVLGTVIALAVAGCSAVRAGYDSAPYQVVRAGKKCEVRHYPAMTVVETPTSRDSAGSDSSFSRLFRFISGGNEKKEKIAMTTPVFMFSDATNATMAFVMPTKIKAGAVPKPSDSTVSVRELAPGDFAVLRYSGGRNAKNEAESLAQLRAWMKQEGLKELSPPVYGYFDPPWTPTFLRRNEVMVRTEAAQP